MSVSLSISWSGLGLSRDVARSSITLAALTGAYASVSPTGREYARAYPNKTLFSCRSTAPELQESSFPGLTGSSRPSSPRGLPNDAATETVDGLTGSSRPSSPRARKEWIIQLGPASRHRSGGESFRYAPHFSLPLGETDAQAPVRLRSRSLSPQSHPPVFDAAALVLPACPTKANRIFRTEGEHCAHPIQRARTLSHWERRTRKRQ